MATPKSRTRKKKKNKLNPWLILVLVIILIALLSIGIGYYLTDEKNTTEQGFLPPTEKIEKTKEPENKQDKIEKTPLEGSWVSMYDGAILTFSGLNFTLDMPSVDAPEKIEGKIARENTIVTFYYTTGKKSCLNVEGHYQYSFEGDELSFKVIKDLCDARKERMTANWFKL